jgi:hypothetical protein
MNQIPNDIKIEVTKYLNYKDIRNLTLTNKNMIYESKQVKNICQRVLDKEITRRIRDFCKTQNPIGLIYG